MELVQGQNQEVGEHAGGGWAIDGVVDAADGIEADRGGPVAREDETGADLFEAAPSEGVGQALGADGVGVELESQFVGGDGGVDDAVHH